MFLAEKDELKEKELTKTQDFRYITLLTDPKIVEITNLHEIIPTGKFKYLKKIIDSHLIY